MADFSLTNEAVADLSGIWNYTFETWSEKQADRYYSMLLDACRKLAVKPKKGRMYNEVYPDLLGYKAHQHIIFYMITTEKEIKIVRILHYRMDVKSRLNA